MKSHNIEVVDVLIFSSMMNVNDSIFTHFISLWLIYVYRMGISIEICKFIHVSVEVPVYPVFQLFFSGEHRLGAD